MDGRRTVPRNDVDPDTLQGLGDHTTMNHDQWPGEIWGLMIDLLTFWFLGFWTPAPATSQSKQELSKEKGAHHERKDEGACCYEKKEYNGRPLGHRGEGMPTVRLISIRWLGGQYNLHSR